MKYLLQCVGSLVYGTIASYLLWLFFWWITPYIMSVGWFLFFVYIILAGGFVSILIGAINSLLAIPMMFLVKDNIVSKIICSLLFGYFLIQSICLPWQLDMQYGLLQWIIAISLTIIFAISFISMIIMSFSIENAD